MVIVNGDQSIVGFPIPEENELPGTNGWVAGGVVGKGQWPQNLPYRYRTMGSM